MSKATVEVWVLVDNDGDIVASHDADLLNDLYEEHVQELCIADGLRRVKVSVTVNLPAVLEIECAEGEDDETPTANVK